MNGISIALPIRSLDPAYGVEVHGSHCTPLERGDLDISYSIDIGDLYRVPYPVT